MTKQKGCSRGCLGTLVGGILSVVAVVYVAVLITNPWAFHIGGRLTPLLYWSGYGELKSETGSHPLYFTVYPARSRAYRPLDNLHPSGGLQGTGAICTATGAITKLTMSGTIYGGWKSTDNSVISVRLHERGGMFDSKPDRGFFDLYGRWQGQNLMMDSRQGTGYPFRSGFRTMQSRVTLAPGSYSDFTRACDQLAPKRP